MLFTTNRSGSVTTAKVIAEVGSALYPLGIIGRGEAKCRAEDAFSDYTGELIAMGRAIQDFGAQVTEVGEGRVITRQALDIAKEILLEGADITVLMALG